MKFYSELADWWPLLSAPFEYEEEAAVYTRQLREAAEGDVRTVLELGSGGGNNASHMKAYFQLTLVDVAPGMLEVSRRLNPECEHVEGDMRSVRLGRQFDGIFVHDAVCYMASREELKSAIETARAHCRPGGAAVFVPDFVRETFRAGCECGGHDDGQGRGLRYLEWTWDPDPGDGTYVADYAFLLRGGDGTVRVQHERHLEGLFSRAEWLELLAEAGFEARVEGAAFVCRRRGAG